MSRINWILACSFVVIFAAGGYWLGTTWMNSGPTKSEIIQEANAEAILNHLRGLKSPVVLVNFWASWCEPCKVEFPHILNLRKELKGKGLEVVFVSLDDPSDFAAAEAFLKEQQVDFLTFYKGNESISLVSKVFPEWSGAVPATVLLGPDLKVLDGWEGDTSLEEFRERVAKFLKGT